MRFMLPHCLLAPLTFAAAAQADPAALAAPPLYARVMHVQAQVGQMDAVTAIYREFVLPSLQQQAGFKGTWLLTDPLSNKGMSITLWDSEASRQEGDRKVMEQVKRVAPLLLAPPIAQEFLAQQAG